MQFMNPKYRGKREKEEGELEVGGVNVGGSKLEFGGWENADFWDLL